MPRTHSRASRLGSVLLRSLLFFDVGVVDVLVVQVVDWVRPVLGQGGDMPVVVTTGA